MRIYLVFSSSLKGLLVRGTDIFLNTMKHELILSLIQCIQCLKKGNEENEKYLQSSPPLSFIIVIPSPITGKEEGRHAGGRRRRIRNI